MGDASDLTEAVRIAKEAVAGLEEPLKTEAFKILLEKLIGSGRPEAMSPGAARQRQAQPKRPSKSTKATAKRTMASSLKLDVATLKTLKSYCERFDLQGSEQIAFVLANFAREHTDLQFVTSADIAYLYRQLVSQRVKVAGINDVADWSRALNWLTAPSRRKEWLEKKDEGFVVSNSGLLRFHELESATTSNAR